MNQHISSKIEALSQDWNLGPLSLFKETSHHILFALEKEGVQLILKVAKSPPNKEEIDALVPFQSLCPPLIKSDKASGALLMKRVCPGTPLDEDPMDEQGKLSVAYDIYHKIGALNNDTAGKDLKNLGQAFKNKTMYKALEPQLHKAELLFNELIKTTTKPRLLHGDLHGQNMIKGQNKWWVIDPKGFRGDPLYDLAVYIKNPYEPLLNALNTEYLLDMRLTYFESKMNIKDRRLRKWVFAQSALAYLWAAEDQLDFERNAWDSMLLYTEKLL